MCPDKAMDVGRVNIAFMVGEAMVLAMVSGPPERPLLQRQASQQCAGELEPAGCLERPVRKIAVIEARQTECTTKVEQCGQSDSCPTPSHPKHCQTASVHEHQCAQPQPVRPVAQIKR